MKYENIVGGTFLDRPNRFIAYVEVDGKKETVHVKNTGRCRELLQQGNKVYLSIADNPNRKTKYDLIAVHKGDRLPYQGQDSTVNGMVWHLVEYRNQNGWISGKYSRVVD